ELVSTVARARIRYSGRRALPTSRSLAEFSLHTLYHPHRAPGRRIGEDHGELIPADAVAGIGSADGCADRLGQRLQPLIAHLMAQGVVHPLEVVQIDQGQRERTPRTLAQAELAGEVLFEGAVVAELSQVVNQSLALESFELSALVFLLALTEGAK